MSRGRGLVGFALLAGIAVIGALVWMLMGSGPDLDTGPALPEVAAGRDRPDERTSAPRPDAVAATASPAAAAGRGVVVGRLVGERGVPLAGTVTTGVPGGGPAETDELGAFRLEVPADRDLRLVARSGALPPWEGGGLRLQSGETRDVGEIFLGRPADLEVRVRDPAGEGLGDVDIELYRVVPATRSGTGAWIRSWLTRTDPGEPRHRFRTGPDGIARFPGIAPGTWWLRATADGRATAARSVSLRADGRRRPEEIVLHPAITLTGTLHGPDGTVPATAEIVAAISNWNQLGTLGEIVAAVDAEGAFVLEGLAPGPIDLKVRFPGPVSVGMGSWELPGVRHVDLVLDTRCRAEGTVVDDATGAALPGVTVTVQTWSTTGNQRGGQAMAMTTTDAEGRFSVANLPAGQSARPMVSHPGYADWPDLGAPWDSSEFTSSSTPLELDVRLKKGTVVSGRVTGPDGTPVPAASVAVQLGSQTTGVTTSETVRTDADGRYRLTAPGTGKGLIQVIAPGWFQPEFPHRNSWQVVQQSTVPEAVAIAIPREGGDVVRDVVLHRGGVVTGRITAGGDGVEVAGLTVSCSDTDGDGGGGRAAPSGTDGSFRIEGVRPGEALRVIVTGLDGGRGTSSTFALAEGAEVENITVELNRGASVEGRLVGPDGGAPTGATLAWLQGKFDTSQPWNMVWQRRNATSVPVAADGTFRIERLAGGVITLLAQADGCAETIRTLNDVRAESPPTDVVVELAAEGVCAGVVETEDGRPLAGASLVVTEAGAQQTLWYVAQMPVAAVTDAEGRFTLAHVAPGRRTIHVTHPDRADARHEVTVPSDTIRIEMKSGLTISGVVVEAGSGRPVANVGLSAMEQNAQGGVMNNTTRTDEQGRFTFERLNDATYRIDAAPQWLNSESSWVNTSVADVQAGTSDLRIELEQGMNIEGRVLMDDGSAAPAQCNVRAEPSRAEGDQVDWSTVVSAQTDADGRFVLRGLRAGTWTLVVSPPWRQARGDGTVAQAFAEKRVPGVTAGSTGIEVRVAAGIVITGRVTTPDGGVPENRGRVAFLDATGNARHAAGVGEDGTFRSPPLDGGSTWTVVASHFGGYRGARAEGVLAGTEGLELVLERGLALSGRVTDASGRSAGGGVPVFASRADGKHQEAGASASGKTAKDGTFRLEGLDDTEYTLSAGGSGAWARTTHATKVRPGAENVVLAVEAGGVVAGRLLDASGEPAKGRFIGIQSLEGAHLAGWIRVDDEGRFRIEGVRRTEVKVMVWDNGQIKELERVTAPAEGLELTLP